VSRSHVARTPSPAKTRCPILVSRSLRDRVGILTLSLCFVNNFVQCRRRANTGQLRLSDEFAESGVMRRLARPPRFPLHNIHKSKPRIWRKRPMHLVRNTSLLRAHVSIHLLISSEELLLAPGRNLKTIDQRNQATLLNE